VTARAAGQPLASFVCVSPSPCVCVCVPHPAPLSCAAGETAGVALFESLPTMLSTAAHAGAASGVECH
jgi:hypothetical protein